MILHHTYIGVDVSKAHVDIFDPRTGKSLRLANTQPVLAGFAAALSSDTIVVLEATGVYDAALRMALDAAAIGCVRVNPSRARDFARASGQLAKTDRLDAAMLARMGSALRLEPDAPSDPSRLRLAALVRRRDQLVAIRACEANHGETAHPQLAQTISDHIDWLDQKIVEIEHMIAQQIKADQALEADNVLLRSAPGIGPVAATTLLALLPELGKISNKAVAALCGLAPLNRDSGTWRGTRRIGQGRKRIRQALYMAALSAARCNQRFRQAYQALRDRGKPAKLALIAIARKLLTTLNAMARNRTPFTQ